MKPGRAFNMRQDYHDVVRRIHDRGIAIMGCFVFGFDHDTLETFDDTVDFVMESRMDLPRYAIAVPFPATGLYRRLKAENRISDRGLELYDGQHVVFEPRNMTADELLRHTGRAWKKTYQLRIDLETARARVGHPDGHFDWSQSRLSLLRQSSGHVLHMRLAARSAGVRPGAAMRLTLVHPCVGRRRGQPYIRTWQMEPLAPATLAGLDARDRASRFASTTIAPKPFPSTSPPTSWP